MLCAKCEPKKADGKLMLCIACFQGWPLGKTLEEYLHKDCLPEPPQVKTIPYQYGRA